MRIYNSNFGDYIVFVDESGDQSLNSINASYPVFVLSFCIFEKTHYYTHVVPEILRLKFDFFGSDIPILHEREIRKSEGDFNILMRDEIRDKFFDRLNQIMIESQYTIVSSLIDKRNTHISIHQTIHIPLVQNLEWNTCFSKCKSTSSVGVKF